MIINEDLLKEIGQRELAELSDLNGTGELDQSVIDDAKRDAISFIESFFRIPAEPTPLLKKIAVELTIMELRRRNELPVDSERKKELEGYLQKMATGKIPTTLLEQERFERPKRRAFIHQRKAR